MQVLKVTDFGVVSDINLLQTEKIQAVLDLCKTDGGKVVFPKGEYRVSSLYVHSNTEIHLESEAIIAGSDEITDYREFHIPIDVQSYHDYIVLKPQIDKYGITCERYTLSMFTSINEKNISYTGEKNSLLDGVHCFNAKGEQEYSGPHTIWMTACENIKIESIAVNRSANFAFQTDNCKNITLDNVTVTRGDDGIHLNGSQNINIKNSTFETGDDSIAGLNVVGLTVDNCYLSSACDIFRLGGKDILIKNCKAVGPCKYPHRVSTFKGKNFDLPDYLGRRNVNVFFCFFASDAYPMDSENIIIKDCEIDTVDRLVYDSQDFSVFQSGGVLKEITFENVTAKNLLHPCFYNPKTVYNIKNSIFAGRNDEVFDIFAKAE